MDNQIRVARMSAHLTWILGLGLLTLFFNQYLEQKYNPNAHLVTADSSTVVHLRADSRGHYQTPGWINGSAVRFLVDTGATYIALSDELAHRLKLKAEGRALVTTANGSVEVQRTTLASVRVGGIEMLNVPAMITPGMDGDSVLLGMSFLQHLQMIQEQGTLSLRIPE